MTEPVNDYAGVIDASSTREIDRVIRTLKAASGDVIILVTVPTVEPHGNVREYAVKLFENHGRGIGEKGKDNGLLIVVALKERRVEIEVGYALEAWITDGYAGETVRDYVTPAFRAGQYGAGLLAATTRIAGRIAQGRNVQLTGVPVPTERRAQDRTQFSFSTIIFFFILIIVLSRLGGGPGRGIRGRRGGWSGWSSGVGPFGGGFGGGGFGGFGGGSSGGGFGGFGGGRSGGGGGGGSW